MRPSLSVQACSVQHMHSTCVAHTAHAQHTRKIAPHTAPMDTLATQFRVTLKVVGGADDGVSRDTYERDLRSMCTLSCAGHVAYLLRHIDLRATDAPFYVNVFRDGVQPVWEDKANASGCDWSLMLRREVGQRYFERAVVHLCSGGFRTFDATGVVLIQKDERFKLSIWSRGIPSAAECGAVIAELKAALGIDFVVTFHYKNHSKILAYHKSLEA